MKTNKKLILALLAILGIMGMFYFGTNSSEPDKEIAFPYLFDENRLEVTNIITFDGPNTDNDNQMGENIAAIQLTNKSNEHLKNISIQLEMQDDQVYSFVIEELPAGKQVLALETDNKTYDGQTKCKDVSFETSFTQDKTDQVSVRVEDSVLSIENTTDTVLKDVTVYYHCLADSFYFGGKVFKVTFPELLPNQVETYVDSLCWMGEAEVVRVEVSK